MGYETTFPELKDIKRKSKPCELAFSLLSQVDSNHRWQNQNL